MPTYAFRCPACATHFEERRSFARSDEPATCPACGSADASKVLSAPSFFSAGVATKALLDNVSSGRAAAPKPAAVAPHPADCPCCHR